MSSGMKDWALKYADIGLAVFPLKPKDKRPVTLNGYKSATTDKEQIEAWWNRCPAYNIGIATGSSSGGLIVIDLDVDENKGINGYETLKEWQREHGNLPETWQSITGRGGYHLFYKSTATNKNRVGLYDGVDIRAEGGYIVAPPSIHPNGHRYEWEQGPGDCEIASTEDRVINFLLGPVPENRKKQSFETPNIIPEGARNSTLYKLACSMRARGDAEEAIRAAVEATNNSRCIPPLNVRELNTLINSSMKYKGGTAPYKAVYDKGKFRPQKKQHEKVSLVCMEDIEEEEISWLYQPYIPRGKVTICAAYPGTGKTFLLCYIAACVSTGRSFFNTVPFDSPPGKTIYLTAEDGIGDTIKKRLRVCGANMKNIATVKDKTQLMFDSPEIEEYMKEYKPDLMIFDPFQAYIGAEVDMNAPNKTRDRLGYIADLAEKYNVAVVLICHFNKNGKGDAITRVLGSTDIMGICRSYIALGPVPGEDGIKFMSHEKSSLDKRGKTMLFKISPENGGIIYLGENYLTMDDYTAIRNKKRTGNAPAIEAAKEFIVNNMPEGRRPAQELKNLATANRISESTLKRAKEELGVITNRTKDFPSRTIWILPGHEAVEPRAKQEALNLQSSSDRQTSKIELTEKKPVK